MQHVADGKFIGIEQVFDFFNFDHFRILLVHDRLKIIMQIFRLP